MKDISILLSKSPRESKVYADGKEVKGLRGVKVEASVDGWPPVVTLSFVPEKVNLTVIEPKVVEAHHCAGDLCFNQGGRCTCDCKGCKP